MFNDLEIIDAARRVELITLRAAVDPADLPALFVGETRRGAVAIAQKRPGIAGGGVGDFAGWAGHGSQSAQTVQGFLMGSLAQFTYSE